MGFVRLTALAAACLAPQGACAGSGLFRTAAGVTVETPAIAGLDCEGMRRVLDALDASGYRGGGPAPVDTADMALLDYENRLSAVFYEHCVAEPAHAARPETAFAPMPDLDDQ